MRDVGVVLEIGGIGHQAAQTDRQREEGLSERGEHRRGRHLREVGSEEEFHAFGAARQQDGVDGQHHEDQQQQRHHDASRAFDPFLDAQCDDAVRQQGEDDGVEQRFPRVLREGVEERFVGFGGTDACEFARERVDHVFQRPARDHQIEAHDEQRSQNTVVAQDRPAARKGAVGAHGVAVGIASDGEFRKHDRHAEQQDAEDVDQQERAAAVLPCDIGETPDVAQSDGAARRDEHGAQPAAECGPMSCLHSLTFSLSRAQRRTCSVYAAAGKGAPIFVGRGRRSGRSPVCSQYAPCFGRACPVHVGRQRRDGDRPRRFGAILPASPKRGRSCRPAGGRVWLPCNARAALRESARATLR